jgi:hypothetical protein
MQVQVRGLPSLGLLSTGLAAISVFSEGGGHRLGDTSEPISEIVSSLLDVILRGVAHQFQELGVINHAVFVRVVLLNQLL